MRKEILYLAACMAAGLAALSPAAAQDPDADEIERRLSLAEDLGGLMYRKDIAAWVATDAILEDDRARPLLSSLQGWVTELDSDGTGALVSFVGENGPEGPAVYYAARTSKKKVISTEIVDATPLTPRQALLWKARQTAMGLGLTACKPTYNTAVLIRGEDTETPEDDEILAYLMPGTTSASEVPIGGYHRVTLTPDAETVMQSRSFSNTCLTMDKQGDRPRGSELAMLFVTHVVSDLPEEHHVFISLSQGVALAVMTDLGLWVVREGRIQPMEL